MIPGLDGIRAVAFLLVLLHHTDYTYIGWSGVQLFFVLSGFLITDILLRMKDSLAVGDYFKKFYGRRFLRIFPLYYFYLFLMFGITALLLYAGYRINYMHKFQEQAPYAFVYVYNFYHASSFFSGESRLLTHFWSLSVEEQFYIFWPLLVFFTPKKYLKTLFLATIVLGPALRLITTLFFQAHPFDLLSTDVPTSVYVLPFSHIDAFGIGAFISRFDIPKPRPQLLALAILLPIVGFSSQYISSGNLGEITALGFSHPLANLYKHIWGYSYLNYLFALVILLVVREKFLVNFLENKFIAYLGKISYGLYVYHFPVIWFVGRIRDFGLSDEAAKPLTLILSFGIALLLASISYRFMEKPILDLKDRYFSLKKPAGAP